MSNFEFKTEIISYIMPNDFSRCQIKKSSKDSFRWTTDLGRCYSPMWNCVR